MRNARDRKDRRLLKCSNKGVFTKVARWRGGRELLLLGGFLLEPAWPATPDPELTDPADEVVEAWRQNAVFVLSNDRLNLSLLTHLDAILGAHQDPVPQSTCQSTEASEASAAAALGEWLEGQGLGQYQQKLSQMGYDLQVLLNMTEAELNEMCDLAAFLPGRITNPSPCLTPSRHHVSCTRFVHHCSGSFPR